VQAILPSISCRQASIHSFVTYDANQRNIRDWLAYSEIGCHTLNHKTRHKCRYYLMIMARPHGSATCICTTVYSYYSDCAQIHPGLLYCCVTVSRHSRHIIADRQCVGDIKICVRSTPTLSSVTTYLSHASARYHGYQCDTAMPRVTSAASRSVSGPAFSVQFAEITNSPNVNWQ